MHRRLPLVLIASIALLIAGTATAGTVLDMKSRVLANDEVDDMTMSIQGRNLAADMRPATGQRQTMLYLGERSEMIAVDHSRRTWMSMDKKKMKAAGGQANDAMAQVREQMKAHLANVPAEQRAMIEQAMKQRSGMLGGAAEPVAPVEYRKTSQRAEKLGHPTRLVEAWRGDEKVNEHWVASWEELDIERDEVAVLEELAEFARDMRKSAGKAGPPPMPPLDSLGGVPVFSVDFEDGRPVRETSLVGVEHRALPPETFQPPADYRKQEMPGMPGGR